MALQGMHVRHPKSATVGLPLPSTLPSGILLISMLPLPALFAVLPEGLLPAVLIVVFEHPVVDTDSISKGINKINSIGILIIVVLFLRLGSNVNIQIIYTGLYI
jgi:hypothetical protein